MMTDKMIDEALVELLRTMKALHALRSARKGKPVRRANGDLCMGYPSQIVVHAAAKRATLDLTRKLAQLRRGD